MIPAVHNALPSSMVFKGRRCPRVQPAKQQFIVHLLRDTCRSPRFIYNNDEKRQELPAVAHRAAV